MECDAQQPLVLEQDVPSLSARPHDLASMEPPWTPQSWTVVLLSCEVG